MRITPVSAEQSSTIPGHEAGYAIDNDLKTYAQVTKDGSQWLRMDLGGIYCIDQVRMGHVELTTEVFSNKHVQILRLKHRV